MATVDVEIKNLDDFQRAVLAMERSADDRLKLVARQAAGLVLDEARGRVPRDSGRARASLKVREGSVVGGGRRAPYFGFLDFGGRVGIRDTTHRRFLRAGRIIYPSFAEKRGKVNEVLSEGLAQLAKTQGLEVSRGQR